MHVKNELLSSDLINQKKKLKGPVWSILGDLLAEMEYNIHICFHVYGHLKLRMVVLSLA